MPRENSSNHLSRRRFIELSALAALTTACSKAPGTEGAGGGASSTASPAPSPTFLEPSTKLSGKLRILQWSHFVPHYDKWFDPYVQQWGKHVGVDAKVDHINYADIVPRTSSEISAGSGHDLIMWISPPSSIEQSVVDLADVNAEAQKRFGKQVPWAKQCSYNPTTDKWYGYCHGWVPDPGDYRKSLWKKVGMANGPRTWDDLLKGGTEIKKNGAPMCIGMSNEIDSNMAARAMIWSFGGSIQDKHQTVVLNSPETIAAVEYMTKLYKQTMTSSVFSWNAASNNQGLAAGKLSYILNSISAYRTAQGGQTKVANDIWFTPALKGPHGLQFASEHVIAVYVVPKFAKNVDAAKEFLLNLSANAPAVTYNSQLYDFPSFPDTVPHLDDWVADDPFGSKPANKLEVLGTAKNWSTNVGHPGPANAAIGEVFNTFVIPQMMAKAARGKLSPEQAVKQAHAQCEKIFAKWHSKGLVG
ncbi:MAG: ABC transporter substrate-binding protein [Streptosporangiales bacterium]